MKHLIETTNLSSLPITRYDRLILDSTKNEIIYKGGVNTNGHSYVDLGLPSGLKWAKCNVGAETETAYGDYFMWGSTISNNDTPCDWEHAPFNNGSSSYDSTYFNSVKDTVCPNGVLAKEYDAAAQIMGGDWRMPTATEFQELYDNTTNEWVTNYKGTVVRGRKFTSKTNGNSIFFPASGFANDTGVNHRDSYGYYWSSSLHPSNSNLGLHLLFNSGYIDPQGINSRCLGFCVRSVCM